MSRVGNAVADALAEYGVEAEPPGCDDGSWVIRRGPGCSDRSWRDFVVLAADLGDFYRELREAGSLPRSPTPLAAARRVVYRAPVPGTQFVFAWTIIGGKRVPVIDDRLVRSAKDQAALCAVLDDVLDARRAGAWTPPVESGSTGREEVVRGEEARWGPASWSVIVFAPGSVSVAYYRKSVDAHRRILRARDRGEDP